MPIYVFASKFSCSSSSLKLLSICTSIQNVKCVYFCLQSPAERLSLNFCEFHGGCTDLERIKNENQCNRPKAISSNTSILCLKKRPTLSLCISLANINRF